jgi:hypothetical protein
VAERKKRSLWWLPLVVLVVILAVVVVMTDQDAPLVQYGIRDDDTIVIEALGGNNWFWTRVHEVRETESTVTVRVRSLGIPILPTGDVGIPYRFVIDLASPLGDRRVVDGATGADVPLVPR